MDYRYLGSIFRGPLTGVTIGYYPTSRRRGGGAGDGAREGARGPAALRGRARGAAARGEGVRRPQQTVMGYIYGVLIVRCKMSDEVPCVWTYRDHSLGKY